MPIIDPGSINHPTLPDAGLVGRAKDQQGTGVLGQADTGIAVEGFSTGGIGVFGHSHGNDGVQGVTDRPGVSGVAGIHQGPGNGVFGIGSPGGRFEGGVIVVGDVEVTGNINCHEKSTITCFDVSLTGADCAEQFDTSDMEEAEPGTVMVINDDSALRACDQAYDKRVAGVISGAGDYKPGIVLDKQQSRRNRKPVALLGKVFCKVDAQYGAIEIGDLLTTSTTCGHAMKADDPFKAFGSVIGKALRPLQVGQGLIPILIALQ